jgi:hypothetical protein
VAEFDNREDREIEDDVGDDVVYTYAMPSESDSPGREWVRGFFAISITAVFGIEVLANIGLAAFTSESHFDRFVEKASIIFSPTVAILGTVVGFYYGERKYEKRD